MIITVANQKGGVGKTDLAVNLSSFLANSGKKVMLVDLDPQANATTYLLSQKPKKTTSELFLDDDLKLSNIAMQTGVENLHIAPGSPRLNVAQVELMNDVGMQFKLKRKLKGHGYDYVVIDTPPSLGMLTINALTASDNVLIPVQVHYFALDGVDKLLNTVKKVRKEINPKLNVSGFILTMYDKRNNLSSEIEKHVRSSFGETVFKTVIPVNVDLATAPKKNMPILLASRESRGAYAYDNLAKEFLKVHDNTKRR